jgi:hypothetical protein
MVIWEMVSVPALEEVSDYCGAGASRQLGREGGGLPLSQVDADERQSRTSQPQTRMKIR